MYDFRSFDSGRCASPRGTQLRPWSLSWVGAIALSLAGAAACNGRLGLPEGDQKGGLDGALQEDAPASATRFRRLTHQEWANTVRDLLGVETAGLVTAFRADPRASGFLFDNNAAALEVDQALASAYQRVAAQIAQELTSDSAKLAALAPGDGTDEERARAFIETFGKRAHRRPLTDEQAARYFALYQAGLDAFDDMPGFPGGMRLLLEGFLQAPLFLYRVEFSEEARGGVVPLDGWERAQRLSYFFWGTMPDDELFQAAAAGELDSRDGVAAQARRLVEDERAAGVIERFYGQVFEVDRYARIEPSPMFFPNVSDTLALSAAEETRQFVRHVVFDEGGGLADLLTSTSTFVNEDLAPIYGLSGTFTKDFRLVELDASQRRGILTQVGFLASHATSVNPDPIHRGVFVAKRINCLKVAAPPDAVPPLPEPGNKTNRELVTEHTEADGSACKNCHGTVINLFGFPFESYDAVGGFRTQDNGKPVDTSASPPVGGAYTEVSGAPDLAEAMASAEAVHECFTKHLVEFAHGRPTLRTDEPITKTLGQESALGMNFKELMVRLAVADSFLNRSVEELP
jgi:hypothetical protein